MITEDYVSFETAKLLRKKGFDYNAEYESYYTFGGIVVYFKDRPQDPNIAPRVTLQMACKWLREVHNLHISPFKISVTQWNFHIFNLLKSDCFGCKPLEKPLLSQDCVNTYEKSVELAITYCLENLI